MGCSALCNLAELGFPNSLLLERKTLGSSATGRSVAILRTHYSNEVCVRMALKNREIIADFQNVTGHSGGFVRTGYLFLVGKGQEDGMRNNLGIAQAIGVNTWELSMHQAADMFPLFDFDGVTAAAYEPDSGYADSSAVTIGFAQAARSSGAQIKLGTNVISIVVEHGRVVAVLTESGERINTGRVIITAGAWARELITQVGANLPISWVRHQVIKVRRPLHLLPSHPTVGDLPNALSLRPDSSDLTLIALREDPADMNNYNPGVDSLVVTDAMDRTAKRIPHMQEAGWDGGWSGIFTVTPDWHPVIDAVPGVDGLYCAVGFSGHGFKLSPAVGLAIAEMSVNGRTNSFDIDPLRFVRFNEGLLVRSSYGPNVFA
mgnify:CR=1 FL=1